MHKLFWRQRRRFLCVITLAALAGLFMNSTNPMILAPIVALGFAVTLTAAVILEPEWRLIVTRLSFWFLTMAILGNWVPTELQPIVLACSVLLAVLVRFPAGLSEFIRLPGIIRLRARQTVSADA